MHNKTKVIKGNYSEVGFVKNCKSILDDNINQEITIIVKYRYKKDILMKKSENLIKI